MIRSRKRKYYEREVQKLSEEGAHQIPYKTLKNMADTERPPAWSMEHMGPQKPLESLAEEAAAFFSSISQEFTPLDRSAVPLTYDVPLTDLPASAVAERLSTIKKPG